MSLIAVLFCSCGPFHGILPALSFPFGSVSRSVVCKAVRTVQLESVCLFRNSSLAHSAANPLSAGAPAGLRPARVAALPCCLCGGSHSSRLSLLSALRARSSGLVARRCHLVWRGHRCLSVGHLVDICVIFSSGLSHRKLPCAQCLCFSTGRTCG